MEDTISNKCKKCKNCKNCRWLKIGRHNTDFSRGEGTCTHPYRNNVNNVTGRVFSSIACRFFEEREDDMLNDENLKDFQAVLDSADKALDSIECVLDRELEIRGEEIKVEPKMPINRYGLGQTLYLPVKVVGIRSKKTPNGGDIVLYELTTSSDQRIGFKIFEHASDIWHDKDRYLVSLPEEYIRDHFKEG